MRVSIVLVFVAVLLFGFLLGFRFLSQAQGQALDSPVQPNPSQSQNPNSNPKKHLPLTMTMKPKKQIFAGREGLTVQFKFKARRPLQLCVNGDPMNQFRFEIARMGVGALPLKPFVARDNDVLFRKKGRVHKLQPGDTYTYRLNLRRLGFRDGERWEPGNYQLKSTFRLCSQRDALNGVARDASAILGDDIMIPAESAVRFMILGR